MIECTFLETGSDPDLLVPDRSQLSDFLFQDVSIFDDQHPITAHVRLLRFSGLIKSSTYPTNDFRRRRKSREPREGLDNFRGYPDRRRPNSRLIE